MLCDLSTGKCPRCGFTTRHIGAKKTCKKLGEKTVSRGLGDTAANALSMFGIKPCGGCEKRKELLNKYFPYKSSD